MLSEPLALTMLLTFLILLLFLLAYFVMIKLRKYSAYGFLAALLKGKEAKCITEEEVLEALKKKNFTEAVEVFSNTELGQYLAEKIAAITTFRELEKTVWEYLSKDILHIKEHLPKDALEFLRNYIIKYDLANVKQVLRRISERSVHLTELIPLGVIFEQGLLDKLNKAASIDEIVDIVKIAGLHNYALVIEKYSKKFTKEANVKKVRMELEKELDNMYYAKLMSLSSKMRGKEQLMLSMGAYIDLLNLSIVVRGVLSGDQAGAARNLLDITYVLHRDVLKSMLESKNLDELVGKIERTPYAEAGRSIMEIYRLVGDVLLVEKTIIDYSMRRIKETISTALLTPAVLLHYLLTKEKEIKLVFLTFRVIEEKLPVEVYSKFIREIR